ncbi:MAG: hypothetical protein R3A52_33390 [Polyangiales bacterium]
MIALAGCGAQSDGAGGANTAAYSDPVNVQLDKFKDGDVREGAFDADKSINTESGNPYGAFLQSARRALGRAPAAVVVDRVTFTLGADTRGVTAFDQVFTGPLVVYLASSSTTVNVGTVTDPSGAGPVEVPVTATRASLDPIQDDLLNGSFKLGIRVAASASRPRSFDVKVATTVYFRALAL